MSLPVRALAALLVLLACAAAARADTLRVPKDFDTIQQAVDAASSGDTILIASGTYVEAVHIEGHEDLTLRGLGKAVIAPPVLDDPDPPALRVDDCSRLRVENLRVRDASYGVFVDASRDLAFVGLRMDGVQIAGLRADSSEDLFVSDLRVDDSARAVQLFGVLRAQLERVRAERVTNTGIQLGSSQVVSVERCRVRGDDADLGVRVDDGCSDVLLRDNSITQVQYGMLLSVSSVAVIGNRVSDVDHGIIAGNGGGQRHAQVLDNRIRNVGGSGILVTSPSSVVAGNRVSKAGAALAVNPDASGGLFYANRVSGSGVPLVLHDDVALLDNSFDIEDAQLNGHDALRFGEDLESSGDTLRVPKDFATIQAALNAADSGDLVLISAGTYLGNVHATDLAGVTVRGKGKVVLRAPGGIALRLEKCQSLRLENLRFEDSDTGLELQQVLDAAVTRCRFRGNEDTDLALENCYAVLTDRCRFDESAEALELSSSEVTVHRRHRLRALEGDTVAGIGASGTLVTVIEANRVDGFHFGIQVTGDQALVRDNRVRDAHTNLVARSEGGVFLDNRVSGGGTGLLTSGANGADSFVLDNRVSKSAEHGLRVLALRAILAGNVVSKAGFSGAEFSCSGVLFADNRVLASGADGLDADAASDTFFVRNTSRKNTGLDLRADPEDANVFVENTLGSTNLMDL